MFMQPTANAGLKGIYDQQVEKVKEHLKGEELKTFMEGVKEDYLDKVQEILDNEDGLKTNEEVDDLAMRFHIIETTQRGDGEEGDAADENDQGWEFKDAREEYVIPAAVSNEAMARHMRMVMRLAMVDKARAHNMDPSEITDSVIDAYVEDPTQVDSSLKVSKVDILRKEQEVLSKNNAAHFRRVLENKAHTLRGFSYRAEQMQAGRIAMDTEYVNMVIKMANKFKVWTTARTAKGVSSAPYSKRSLNALYNEAIHTLVALGQLKEAFVRKEYNSEEECSFFMHATAEGMVEVKSGSDWAEDLRVLYYEVDDGTGRTSVRTSND
jgi:hypothetical protein